MIRCVNYLNESIEFDYCQPNYCLDSVTGLDDYSCNITTTSGASFYGQSVTSTTINKRNIVLTVLIFRDFMQSIRLLQRIFLPHNQGKLIIEDRFVNYYVESIDIRDTRQYYKIVTISLVCPDPFFYDIAQDTISNKIIIPNLEYDFEYVAEGIEYGIQELTGGIYINNDTMYDGHAKITIHAEFDNIQSIEATLYNYADNKMIDRVNIIFGNIQCNLGDVIVINSIDKTITKNGNNIIFAKQKSTNIFTIPVGYTYLDVIYTLSDLTTVTSTTATVNFYKRYLGA